MDSPVQLSAGITGRKTSIVQTDDPLLDTTSTRRMSKGRRPSFCRTDTLSTSKSNISLLTGLPPGGRLLSVEHTWSPVEASFHDSERKVSANVIDKRWVIHVQVPFFPNPNFHAASHRRLWLYSLVCVVAYLIGFKMVGFLIARLKHYYVSTLIRSLYSIKREHIASRELAFLPGSPRHHDLPAALNIEHLIEKNYIINSKLPNAIPEKFPSVILNKFHRLSDTDDKNSYGMPRPPTAKKKPFEVVMDGLKREPSVVYIGNYPTLQEPIRCSESDEFCEILGPSACQICIENTNRFIGEQLQHMSFPTINISTEKLIYPKLSKLMKDGHAIQVRKKRMRDLGLEVPHSMAYLKRKETHLTSSTCMSCKKRIANKLNITSRKPINVPKLKLKYF